MSELPRTRARVLRWLGARPLPVWYDDGYRLPVSELEGRGGIERRRAEYVLWALVEAAVIRADDVRQPPRASYADLALVHDQRYLDSLHDPLTLGRIFAVPADEVPVDAFLGMARLATGGTIAAAREALRRRGPALNLLGGFHHAAPNQGGGLCPVNDIAVAVAVLRREGFSGRVCVIDLDAHPPDGTAACLAADPRAWIGSLSGCDWGPLGEHVDETVLPTGCGDVEYLRALDMLLDRMPRPALAFVLAGGDVLAGDKLGKLGLSLAGARRRDLRVAAALAGRPSVWLPAGGYHADAWRILAGTGMALSGRGEELVPDGDPLRGRFAVISADMDRGRLGTSGDFAAIIEEMAGVRQPVRLLGFYNAEGLEYALEKYGILDILERSGYRGFHVEIDDHGVGVRARLFARWGGAEHVLIETVLERKQVAGRAVCYVHWLALRNPRVAFTRKKPALPGQDAPGLGLAREMTTMFERMAVRPRRRRLPSGLLPHRLRRAAPLPVRRPGAAGALRCPGPRSRRQRAPRRHPAHRPGARAPRR
jgi:acetoin utilization deacetylase AcuC-like enzyme